MFRQLVLLLLHVVLHISAKVYDRCQLAHELKYVHKFPGYEIPTWICIVAHESIYDTAAMNPGSGDHGLFQISQIYWCSPPGDGFGCNAPCANFRDDDIEDDVKCVQRIFKEHTRISGDGFNAWAVYPLYCKGDTSTYIKGCFKNDTLDIENAEEITSVSVPTDEYTDEDDDGYDFPPLPRPPKQKLESVITDDDYYEFPPLPTIKQKTSTTVLPKREEHVSLTYNTIRTIFRTTVPSQYSETFIKTRFSGPIPSKSTFTEKPVSLTRSTQVATNKQVTTQKPLLRTTLHKGSKSTNKYLNEEDITPIKSTFYTSHAVTSRPKQITNKLFAENSLTLTTSRQKPLHVSPLSLTQAPVTPKPSESSNLELLPDIRLANQLSVLSNNKSSIVKPVSNRPGYSLKHKSKSGQHLNLTTVSLSETYKNLSSYKKYTVKPPQFKTSITPMTLSTHKRNTMPIIGQTFSTSLATTPAKVLTNNVKLAHPTEKSLKKIIVSTVQPPNSKTANRQDLSTTHSMNTKREKHKYENQFPGYFFFRIGNGFKLIQNVMP